MTKNIKCCMNCEQLKLITDQPFFHIAGKCKIRKEEWSKRPFVIKKEWSDFLYCDNFEFTK